MAIRLQQRRVKGWRKPPGVVLVGRGTKWGNPFRVGVTSTGEEVVAKHRAWVLERPELITAIKAELRGWDLMCWCELGAPCHADTLLEIANS
jgi:hypothetical protein